MIYTRLITLLCLLMAGGILWVTKQETNPSSDEIQLIEKALPLAAPTKAKKARRLLIFNRTETYFHQSIPVGTKALQRLGEKTEAYQSEISQDYVVFAPDELARFDAVLFLSTTQLKLSPDQQDALLEFVRSGKGIIGIHAATDNFYEWQEGHEMMGGLFAGHPWYAHSTVKVKLDEPLHPLNACFHPEGFHIQDEIYQFKAPYSRKKQRVLLSLDMSDPATAEVKTSNPQSILRTDDDFAISWIKHEGKGRVFYSSLGHNKHIFWNTQVLQHYLAGIQYALGDYEVPDRIP